MSKEYLLFVTNADDTVFTKKELKELRRLEALALKRRAKSGSELNMARVVDDEDKLYPFLVALDQAESGPCNALVISMSITTLSEAGYTTLYADTMACKEDA